MKAKAKAKAVSSQSFPRLTPDPRAGLTPEQVSQRVQAGAVNIQPEGLTPSVGRIVVKNSLTLFNLINLFLAVVIILVGHPENILFFGVVICNTAMGIFQELRAKKTLDKLSVLAQSRVAVLRGGKQFSIPQDEIVLDDILLLAAGDQVCADAVVLESSHLEADESLLTGEADRIQKAAGDPILSGSYVTAGHATVHVTAVGQDNYASALTAEAKGKKSHKSKLLQTLNMIIRVLTIIIIPLGILLFYSSFHKGLELPEAVLGAAAAMTGMLPGGLVLLTGITMTVGAMNLAKRKALVQSLASIETLARVDVLCLDKTGTITDGALVYEGLEAMNGATNPQVGRAVAELMAALGDQNSTAKCLREAFREPTGWRLHSAVPFSSDRKWSGASFSGVGSYLLGAPGILFPGNAAIAHQVNRYTSQGFRVLCLAYSRQPLQDSLPGELVCHGLLFLSDSIRDDAIDTFRYFAEEGVTLKVISGDNPGTVSTVAIKAGIANADRAVDMSDIREEADFAALSEEYTVFGHVTPRQKQLLIQGLQQNGHTACMTGDGVNDILAMREADCSVAMAGGSSAARSACDFVLLSKNFSAMKGVLKEGRRVINNIERVAAIYMVSTTFAMLLSLIYTFLPFPYPYVPQQMTPINAFTVGIPTFFLALQPNYSRPEGKMVSNIFEHSLPAAFTIVFNTLYLQLAGVLFELSTLELSTMVVFMVGVVGFYLLLRIARPYTRGIKVMIAALVTGFLLMFTLLGEPFGLGSLMTRNAFFYLPLMYFSFHIHGFLGQTSRTGIQAFYRYRTRDLDEV